MLRILIKKQLFEVFKGYFYNQKKNKMRSKAGIVVFFIFFLLIMVGVLGGMFTVLALSLCGGMVKAGMGWLYFLILSGLAIVFGAFGSVFNTYSGLYLSKDNDLLLSMPIPPSVIHPSPSTGVGEMRPPMIMLPTNTVYLSTMPFLKNDAMVSPPPSTSMLSMPAFARASMASSRSRGVPHLMTSALSQVFSQ
jgi:ABC-2 type transport system permease protein